jgi:ABC-type glycerol-3-phosphate transport system permease component
VSGASHAAAPLRSGFREQKAESDNHNRGEFLFFVVLFWFLPLVRSEVDSFSRAASLSSPSSWPRSGTENNVIHRCFVRAGKPVRSFLEIVSS